MKGLVTAIQFLTRFSIRQDLVLDEQSFGRIIVYFPWVGLLIGTILAVIYLMLSQLLPLLPLACLLLVFHVAITGGLHLDGFMDTFDGILSGRARERMLEIMKDSRVGANSVTAVICLLLFKFAAFSSLSRYGILLGIPAAAVLGRWAMVEAIVSHPYVRTTGLGKFFSAYSGKREWWLATLSTVILMLVLFQLWGLVFFAVAFGFTKLCCRYLTRKLGGLTGDTYGCLCELTEAVVLLVLLILWPYMIHLGFRPLFFW